MNFQKLVKIIFDEIKPKLEKHAGLSIFAKERAKFEGWFKVEVCESLLKYFKNVVPEHQRVDISFKDWGIELKTINTNINYEGVEKKTRPITKNTQGIIEDIEKLKKLNFKKKGVLFIVFPIEEYNKNWKVQFQRIRKQLTAIKSCPFSFKGNIPGVIYFGLI